MITVLPLCYKWFGILTLGTMHTGTVISKGDMQKVLNQHQNNQFAQDVPFMGGDDSNQESSGGTGMFDPGNVHSQVTANLQDPRNKTALTEESCKASRNDALSFQLLSPTFHALNNSLLHRV